jgi:hypothetical protein
MARKSSVVAPTVALVLGLGVLIGGLASAQDSTEYLSCRFQEETDPFTVSSFTTQEEAIREVVGREVDLGDGPLDITVLRKTVTEDGDVLLLLGINRIATAQVGVTSNGYAVSAYRTCAARVAWDAGMLEAMDGRQLAEQVRHRPFGGPLG